MSARTPRACAAGGDVLLAGGAELIAKLPGEVLRELDVRGRVFANAGNLLSLAGPSRPAAEHWRTLRQSYRASVGVGLLVPTSFGRLELNFSQPVRMQQVS